MIEATLACQAPRVVERKVLPLSGDYGMKIYKFDTIPPGIDAKAYFDETIKGHYREIVPNHFSGIAFVYGFTTVGEPVIGMDIMSLRRTKSDLIGNQMVDSWEVENGKLIPSSQGIACEAEILIVAEEIRLRKQSDCTFAYLSAWPDIGALAAPDMKDTTNRETLDWLRLGRRCEILGFSYPLP
jgi:hypothetical protein